MYRVSLHCLEHAQHCAGHAEEVVATAQHAVNLWRPLAEANPEAHQHRGSVPTDPTETDCPGCGATHGVQRITGTPPTVDAWMCAAYGMHRACTVANPVLSIVGLLPTPQLRTAALLATLRTEVTQRSGKGHPMTICLPATEVINIDAMASVDTVVWRCQLCDHHGTTTTRSTAHFEGIEHLTAEHHATIGITPE